MSKTLKLSIVAIVILILVYLFASPYLALYQIKNAAQSGNADKLSEYIDYPSVRQSLKDQMNAHMVKEMAKEKNTQDGFAALGTMLASAMVEKMVDAVVTPQGMTLLLQGKDFKQQAESNQDTTTPQDSTSGSENHIDYSLAYQSFNHVNVKLHNKAKPEKGDATVKMERDGLSWKIKSFEVPMDDK